MTRRLIAVEIDGTIMTLRGWKAHGLAIAAGLRPTYNGVRQGWVADTKRLGDFLAYCEQRNIGYVVADDRQHGDLALDDDLPGTDDIDLLQPALFEGA